MVSQTLVFTQTPESTHLVDVAVRPVAHALDQLEVLLRVPAGHVRTAAHLPAVQPDAIRIPGSRTDPEEIRTDPD